MPAKFLTPPTVRLLAACAILSALTFSAAADVVRLASGHEVRGVVIQDTEARVVIRTAGGVLTFPRSGVSHIERADPKVNALRGAQESFSVGNLPQGVTFWLEAASLGATDEDLTAAVTEPMPSLLRQLRTLSGDQRDGAVDQLRRLRDTGILLPEGALALARAFSILEAWSDASATLHREDLAEALERNPRVRAWARQLLLDTVRERTRHGDFEGALEELERLRGLTPEEAGRQEPILLLAATARAREQGEHGEALRLLADRRLREAVPEITRNRARRSLRILVEKARSEESYANARRVIAEHGVTLLPLEGRAALLDLTYAEARQALASGSPEKALELLGPLEETQLNEDMVRLLNQAQFRMRRAGVGETDPLQLLELARWAEDHDLPDEALEALEDVRRNPTLAPVAAEQISLVKEKRDLDRLDRAIKLYDQGLLEEAVEVANSIELDPTRRSAVADRAHDLAESARRELKNEDARRPYQAEALYQMAERAHYMDSPQEAWNLLTLVRKRFEGTPAAERAAQLLPEARQELELALLEGRVDALPNFEDFALDPSAVASADALSEEIAGLIQGLEARWAAEGAGEPLEDPIASARTPSP